MSVIFLNGSGSLICDGVDAGQIEFSIAEPSDSPDTTKRGKLWGNKQAITAAMDAQKVELKPSDAHDLLSLDVEDTDRQGTMSFSVL
ncbi:hypothetical protein [Brucella pecoris]|uniref:Uncharacterized protein n=1 Tax=Brucella pecoris TaxID=867683 RepID=A0A5C5CCK6_9HYPH|nr:hypothetical protein [Brucella pecoris]MBB4096146.1 hypothetical protein [Brucella pecoris]TNV08814.1 hypothetical protein FIB18_23140 [Brucella pecoris]